jgi:hypothetical protein
MVRHQLTPAYSESIIATVSLLLLLRGDSSERRSRDKCDG